MKKLRYPIIFTIIYVVSCVTAIIADVSASSLLIFYMLFPVIAAWLLISYIRTSENMKFTIRGRKKSR